MLGRIRFPQGNRPSAFRLRMAGLCLTLAAVLPGLILAEPVQTDLLEGSAEFRQTADGTWQPLNSGQTLTLPVEVRTGESGSVTLSQSGASLKLKGATELALAPADTGSGSGPDQQIDTITHRSGTVFYQIDDRPGEIEVLTPSLTSTVHGTRFVIVTTDTGSFVTLNEGELTVTNRETGLTSVLDPGEVIASSSGSSSAAGVTRFNSVPPRNLAASQTSAEQTAAPYGTSAPPGEDGFEMAFAAMDQVAAEQQMVAAEASGAFADDAPSVDVGMEDDMAGEDQGPVGDDMPSDDQGPVEDDMPSDDQGPVEDDMPSDDQGPVEDDMPSDDQGPVEDDMPSDDQGPVEDDMPSDDQGPVEDDMPGDDDIPADDDFPNDDGPVGDDDQGSIEHCFFGHCHEHPRSDWDPENWGHNGHPHRHADRDDD